MQRVRIGLTGLACVFLLVVLAASLFGLVGEDRFADSNGSAAVSVKNEAAPPKEPLAELGVAPGNMPDDTTNSVQPLARAARR
ncbi:hypothetical protein KOF26_07865 [Sphingomonas sp. XMGL2]|uniref:Uncharacterized protein n=2 Tax=Sphingomonas quercus TaxID=2842451 RepID=A0ABS6BHI8_9SPHN|nr:hypothetical protein [Sphingomonas quercus]